MSVPLATLRRHSQLVWLHDALGAPAPQAPANDVLFVRTSDLLDARRGKRLAFSGLDHASNWLQHWRLDNGALMALRSALQRGERLRPQAAPVKRPTKTPVKRPGKTPVKRPGKTPAKRPGR